MMHTTVGIILIVLGFPLTAIVVSIIRHSPTNTAPGVGTQHILLIGLLVQVALIGGGIAILLAGQ